MDLRERHFGRIATQAAETDAVVVDVGSLVRRLLLFEHCFLESIRLKEIPVLVQAFGYDGLMTLIKSSEIQIICDALTAASVGQAAPLKVTDRRGGVLPLGSYRIVAIGMADRKEFVHGILQNVHEVPGIPLKKIIKLKKELAARLLEYPVEAGAAGIVDYRRALETESPMVRRALAVALQSEIGRDVARELEIHVEDLGNDGDYRVATNLTTKFGVDEAEAHRLVERGLLGIAGLTQRLQLMRVFNALTGFRDEEAPIFEESLAFLASQLDPDAQERRFDRVVTIAGLPTLENLPADEHIDVEKLLELRDTPECRELRLWLRNIDTETDAEINEQFESIREHLASITHSRVGATVRFVVAGGAGAIPGVGLVAGPAASLADKFLVEKLIGNPGPVSFLNHKYRSIFNND